MRRARWRAPWRRSRACRGLPRWPASSASSRRWRRSTIRRAATPIASVSRADGGRALGAWLGVVAIWSTTPLTIKWSAEGLGAVAGFSGRTLVGATIFLLAFLTPWLRFDHRPEV